METVTNNQTNQETITQPEPMWKKQDKFIYVTDNFFVTPTIGKISEAIAKAQAIIEKVIKNTDNKFFHSKYADLAAVIDVTRAFAENGVAITQHASNKGNLVEVTTILSHPSGEAMGSILRMQPADQKSQTVGATITYARRYALAAITNVAQEDDDGNAASGRDTKKDDKQPDLQTQKTPQQTPKKEPAPTAPKQEKKQINAEEQLLAEKKARLDKMPPIMAKNDWFASDKTFSPTYGKKMVNAVCRKSLNLFAIQKKELSRHR